MVKRKHPSGVKGRSQSSGTEKSPSSGSRGAGPKTQHSRWQIAKQVYGVVFLVVVIYVGINLLRG